MDMTIKRAVTVSKYGTEIDDLIRSIRKWMTDRSEAPSGDEILARCEDEFFGSELSYRTSSRENEIIIGSISSDVDK
jgi:hypothetical protein